MVDFGNTLRQLRTDAGMSQSDLAKRLHVTKSVVSYYELHERTPSPDVLIKIAEVFHVSTDHLLGIEHKKVIDVSDLSDDDFHFLLLTIEALRRRNQHKD